MAAQRYFKIKEHLLKGQRSAPVVGIRMVEFNKPIPDVVWMRYNLTLNSMNKRFNNTEDLFDYIIELEDFIFSAGAPENPDPII